MATRFFIVRIYRMVYGPLMQLIKLFYARALPQTQEFLCSNVRIVVREIVIVFSFQRVLQQISVPLVL